MKLLRFKAGEGARLGVVKGDGIVDLSGLGAGFGSIQDVIAGGQAALDRINDHRERSATSLETASATLLAPLRPGKYMAIGMNYQQHAEEAEKLGVATPKQQFWFNKQTTCISGPFDAIDPGVTEKLDYEVELAVVVGPTARYVSEQDAPAHIFGYTVANDVSARDWQFHSPTFTIGKSFDTHGPIGPWIVTADEVADPHALDLRCFVNGQQRQHGNTAGLIHNIFAQIAYLSTAFTLEAGDLIATGTPHGVGVAMDPPTFLQPGDVVRCEIDGIGAIENRVAVPAPRT